MLNSDLFPHTAKNAEKNSFFATEYGHKAFAPQHLNKNDEVKRVRRETETYCESGYSKQRNRYRDN